MKVVVLLAGNAGAGKDTAADILCAMTGGVKMAYADPLKDAVSAMIGIPKSVLYGTQEQKESFLAYGKSARHWLQFVGTDLCRNHVHQDIWVHRLADRILASASNFICCSDCRFRNEIDGLKARLRESANSDIKVISARIVNPRVPVNLAHRSESEIHNLPREAFDATIANDGSLDDLRAKLWRLASDYFGGHLAIGAVSHGPTNY